MYSDCKTFLYRLYQAIVAVSERSIRPMTRQQNRAMMEENDAGKEDDAGGESLTPAGEILLFELLEQGDQEFP
jgi:hypothetical protein